MEQNESLYSSREDWKDVKPVEQSDLSNPLVPIFYPPEYKDATDYFRGIVAVNEKSERVLELTEHIISMNPAHYSVWQYRFDTLIALKKPLEEELALMDELAMRHMKYYQVWHHRRLLVTEIKNPKPELVYLASVLAVDAKNYHTWAYRQWLLTHFDQADLWENELSFTEGLLDEDLRNNSAWHHRFFVVFESGVREGDEDRDHVLRRELNFVKQKISVAPNNLSSWNYLRGVLQRTGKPFTSLKEFVVPFTEIVDEREEDEVLDLENPLPSAAATLPCSLAIEFLADIQVEEGENALAAELFSSLATRYDTMRKKYWNYRANEVSSKTAPE